MDNLVVDGIENVLVKGDYILQFMFYIVEVVEFIGLDVYVYGKGFIV